MIYLLRYFLPGLLCMQLVACSSEVDRLLEADQQMLALGKGLYLSHCARCHGQGAQGAQNWKQPDSNGFYPPPPLNGQGHMWHHPLADLQQVMRDGRWVAPAPDKPEQLRMPAWGARLSQAEMDAVLAWLFSLWPKEIRTEWADINQSINR